MGVTVMEAFPKHPLAKTDGLNHLSAAVHGLFVPWTVHTVDCSYPPGLFVPCNIRTFLDCLYHGLFIPSLDDS